MKVENVPKRVLMAGIVGCSLLATWEGSRRATRAVGYLLRDQPAEPTVTPHALYIPPKETSVGEMPAFAVQEPVTVFALGAIANATYPLLVIETIETAQLDRLAAKIVSISEVVSRRRVSAPFVTLLPLHENEPDKQLWAVSVASQYAPGIDRYRIRKALPPAGDIPRKHIPVLGHLRGIFPTRAEFQRRRPVDLIRLSHEISIDWGKLQIYQGNLSPGAMQEILANPPIKVISVSPQLLELAGIY